MPDLQTNLVRTNSLTVENETQSSKAVPEFFAAVRAGETATVAAMLEANPELLDSKYEQATPLHHAALENRREVVDLLLKLGADLNARDAEFNMTPIGWANEKGHRELVSYLASRGAEINFYAAVAYGLIDRVRDFLDTDTALLNEPDHYGTPIHEASLWGHVEIARLLLEHGADASLKNTHGQTALQVAQNQLDSHCGATPIVNDVRRNEISSGCRSVVELLQRT